MLNKKQMDELTTDLMYNVFRNDDIVFDTGEYTIDLLEIIASLHNMLYKEVTGEYYDYAGHHYNKVAGGWIEDGLYKKYSEVEYGT